MSKKDYGLEFEVALRHNSQTNWLQWLEQVEEDDRARELGRTFLIMGAEMLEWDFRWIHAQWERYSGYLRGAEEIETIRELFQHQIECESRPRWEDYLGFEFPAGRLRLSNDGERQFLGEVVANKYRIAEWIGAGRFGIVYRAVCLDSQRTVALKVPAPTLQSCRFNNACRLLEEEEKALRSAAGKGVPEVLESLHHDGIPVLVMEFVDGRPLSDLPTDSEKSRRKVAAYLAQVAGILDRYDSKGLIHRDLKPDNILIDRDETAYIVDFGLGLDEAARFDEDTRQAGTRPFMPPELLTNMLYSADGRSDLWAIGTMLRDAFSDQAPPAPETNEEAFVASLLGSIGTSASDEEPASGIQQIIDRCLARDPDRRFNTGKELAGAIHAWLRGDEPNEVPPNSIHAIGFWRFAMKASQVLRTLSTSRAAVTRLRTRMETESESAQSHSELHEAVAYAHGAIVFLAELQRTDPPIQFQIPEETAEFFRTRFYQPKKTCLEEATAILAKTDSMMNAVKYLLKECHEKAAASSSNTERFCYFAIAISHVVQPEKPLDVLATECGLREELWAEPVHTLQFSNDPREIENARKLLNVRVERFLLYGDEDRERPDEPDSE
jgi:serine/threonine protein kinase